MIEDLLQHTNEYRVTVALLTDQGTTRTAFVETVHADTEAQAEQTAVDAVIERAKSFNAKYTAAVPLPETADLIEIRSIKPAPTRAN